MNEQIPRNPLLNPGLYRAKLSCKIGRDALNGEKQPPAGVSRTEYALFNLLHAVEEIANAMADIKNP